MNHDHDCSRPTSHCRKNKWIGTALLIIALLGVMAYQIVLGSQLRSSDTKTEIFLRLQITESPVKSEHTIFLAILPTPYTPEPEEKRLIAVLYDKEKVQVTLKDDTAVVLRSITGGKEISISRIKKARHTKPTWILRQHKPRETILDRDTNMNTIQKEIDTL